MTSKIFRCRLEGREKRKQLTFIRSRRTQGGTVCHYMNWNEKRDSGGVGDAK